MHKKIDVRNRAKYIAVPAILDMLFLFYNRAYLCGGAIRAYLNSEPVADYDMVFVDSFTAGEANKLLSNNKLFKKVFQCPEGKLSSYQHKGVKIQLITDTYYTGPEAIIESFDFTICQFAFSGTHIHTTEEALRDTKSKLLVVNKLQYPAASLGRIQKYLNRGYRYSKDFKVDFIAASKSNQVIDDHRTYID